MVVDDVSLIKLVFLTNEQTEQNYRINTTNEDYTLQIKDDYSWQLYIFY